MIDNPILQALSKLKRDAPDAAHEIVWDSLVDSFPAQLTRLHLSVYRLMLDVPGLGAVDAMEVLAKIGILLQQEKESEK